MTLGTVPNQHQAQESLWPWEHFLTNTKQNPAFLHCLPEVYSGAKLKQLTANTLRLPSLPHITVLS